jgi:hypothetical protein
MGRMNKAFGGADGAARVAAGNGLSLRLVVSIQGAIEALRRAARFERPAENDTPPKKARGQMSS